MEEQESWRVRLDGEVQMNITSPDERISLSAKYVASMYYVLNALESGQTTSERAFAIFAELIRAF